MSEENETVQTEKDRKALEAFVVGNEDLEQLEALLDRFNIFEAIGVVRQELRHSDFLVFLLDPQTNHGLGDAFVKKFLQQILTLAEDDFTPVTPIELELRDLGRMEVRREWRNIDILLVDHDHEMAVIIENKIDTIEHSDQLQRYREVVSQEYPGWNMMKVYLTPGGDLPSTEDYLAVGYSTICEIVDGLVESRASTTSPDLTTLMVHYTEMLRRHIVEDSEIARLSKQIYQKHRQALDLIYEHRPDRRAELREFLESLVREEKPHLVPDISEKNLIRFVSKEWDKDTLKAGEEWAGEWTETRRMLIFEMMNLDGEVRIKLIIGPGPEDVRQKLLDVALGNSVFNPIRKKLSRKWNTIFSRRLVKFDIEPYEEENAEEIQEKLRQEWKKFLEHDLPSITAALKEEEWIWEP